MLSDIPPEVYVGYLQLEDILALRCVCRAQLALDHQVLVVLSGVSPHIKHDSFATFLSDYFRHIPDSKRVPSDLFIRYAVERDDTEAISRFLCIKEHPDTHLVGYISLYAIEYKAINVLIVLLRNRSNDYWDMVHSGITTAGDNYMFVEITEGCIKLCNKDIIDLLLDLISLDDSTRDMLEDETCRNAFKYAYATCLVTDNTEIRGMLDRLRMVIDRSVIATGVCHDLLNEPMEDVIDTEHLEYADYCIANETMRHKVRLRSVGVLVQSCVTYELVGYLRFGKSRENVVVAIELQKKLRIDSMREQLMKLFR